MLKVASSAWLHAFYQDNNIAMNIENYQSKLKDSISYFVTIGMSVNHSYSQLWPSEQGNMMFGLIMAARRLSMQVIQAVRLQEMSLSDVTGLHLVETRGQLLSLITYLEQGDCDLDISYCYSENSRPLFDPSEIIEEENLNNFFPEKERTKGLIDARKQLISTAPDHFAELIECLNGIIEKIEKLIDDFKKLRRDPELRMVRLEAMEKYYLKYYWPQDKKLIEAMVEGELIDEDNKGKSPAQILQGIIRNLESDNERNCNNKLLQYINQQRDDKEIVAKTAVDNRDELSFDDMMAHLQYRESRRLVEIKIRKLSLLAPCQAYQGKLFANNAAYELARLLGKSFYNYIGFDKKVKAAFIYAALKDVQLVQDNGNNARLMADFINNEWLNENDDLIKDDDITRPLRNCDGRPFCTIDENNLRSYKLREFNRYKEPYWRAFSIINKVLVINQTLECAPYLDELHPIIDEEDVVNYLKEDEKAKINYINSDAGLIWG